MKPRKPVIAITKSIWRSRLSWTFLSLILRLLGAKPVGLTEKTNYKSIHFDALILSGGIDVHPSRYEGTDMKEDGYDPERDEMEFFLLDKAEKMGIPVLGICRGAQLMNIARGGNLHFDVSKAYEKANYPNSTLARIFYRKRMYIEDKESLIYKILKCDSCKVNSIHSQSVNDVGQNLVVTAQEENGVIQVIEDQSRPYFMGVQFHPEYLTYSPLYRELFRRFVNTAKKNLGS